MSPNPRPETVTLGRPEIETAIMMFMKEVRGVPMKEVERIIFPVFTQGGDPRALVTVAPQVGHGAGI